MGLAGIWLAIKALRIGMIKAIKRNWFILFFFLISVLILFLMLEQSKFIWQLFTLLQEIQFPWRFLGVISFTIAALGGFWLAQVKDKKIVYVLAILISVLAIYGNRNHLLSQRLNKPELYYDFENLHKHRYSTTTFADDIINKSAQRACSFKDPFLVIKKRAIEHNVNRGNTFGNIEFEWPETETVDMIKLNLEYFPGIYQFIINGKKWEKIENRQGRVFLPNVKLKPGKNKIDWQIVQSPIERCFNGISLGFLVFWLILIPVYGVKRKT